MRMKQDPSSPEVTRFSPSVYFIVMGVVLLLCVCAFVGVWKTRIAADLREAHRRAEALGSVVCWRRGVFGGDVNPVHQVDEERSALTRSSSVTSGDAHVSFKCT
jgi:hypothetical protein